MAFIKDILYLYDIVLLIQAKTTVNVSYFIPLNSNIYIICVLLCSIILSIILVPLVQKLAAANNLTATPSARKSHSLQVPILGGVAVYLSAGIPILLFSVFFQNLLMSNTALVLGFGSTTLIVLGVKDDVSGVRPVTKLIFQLCIAVFVLFILHIKIESMNGLLGLFELPKTISIILSVFVYVIFMNMLNLIDGIDGLASGIALFAFTFFAYLAYKTSSSFILLICISCIGSILPFMYFNMFSDKKIFLGDNGSLTLGFMLGFLTLDFLSHENSEVTSFLGQNTSLVIMSLFSFPLVDTLRVFMIRVLRKRSPFSADKNHIHHHLLRLGLSHRFATLLILVYTMLITIFSFLLLELNINFAFVILLTVSVFCLCLPTYLERKTNGSIHFKSRH
ncbi:MAG: MraY family glycosyltransferase [Bacteroidetes bacterium]|nr:MraY family glycosyltransferase [Bacteroidota bacterium]